MGAEIEEVKLHQYCLSIILPCIFLIDGMCGGGVETFEGPVPSSALSTVPRSRIDGSQFITRWNCRINIVKRDRFRQIENSLHGSEIYFETILTPGYHAGILSSCSIVLVLPACWPRAKVR